ncbi:MAG: DHH family phosphoesterase [Candidatus Thermoplasmatota archaeon]|nr:DHH family phosphoesterase [Candidatus Thermoplasmatota archaeon]
MSFLSEKSELIHASQRAAEAICAAPSIRVISHYDADGLAAAGVVAEALRRMGKRFHLTIVHDPNADFIEMLAKENNELTIFCDMGSGQIDEIQKLGKVIICDHHKPPKMQQYLGDIIQINSHIFGIDGTYEASASTVAFVLAIALSDMNWDLCQVGLAGAIGDRQGIFGLKGLNREIAEEGAKRGHIIESIGLNISGSAGTKLRELLAGCSDPFFCGVSGELEKADAFLSSLKISSTFFHEISKEKQSALISILAMKLIKQGARPEIAERLVGKRYLLKNMGTDCEHMADLLNACGRSSKESLGVSLCINFCKYQKDAEALLSEYQKKILDGVMRLRAGEFSEMKAIQHAEIADPALAGTVMGLALNSFLNQEKPAIGISIQGDKAKVSSRGTKYLVDKGLDLAYALKTASEFVGGYGGGHPIASGATIPKEKTKEFLAKLDEIVELQLNPFRDASELAAKEGKK